jgi:hypothetical protein
MRALKRVGGDSLAVLPAWLSEWQMRLSNVAQAEHKNKSRYRESRSATDKYGASAYGNRSGARRRGPSESLEAVAPSRGDRSHENHVHPGDRARIADTSSADDAEQTRKAPRNKYHRVGNKIVSYGERAASEAPPTDVF